MPVIILELLSFCPLYTAFACTNGSEVLCVGATSNACVHGCIHASSPERLVSQGSQSQVCPFRCPQKHIDPGAASAGL